VPGEAESNRSSLGQGWTALPGAEQIEYIGEEKARGGRGERKAFGWKDVTPGVFVRVARHGGQANTGLRGYGTWKSVRRMGDSPGKRRKVRDAREKRKTFGLK
jgi:hypothetical protein